jgi:hypothetical protein
MRSFLDVLRRRTNFSGPTSALTALVALAIVLRLTPAIPISDAIKAGEVSDQIDIKAVSDANIISDAGRIVFRADFPPQHDSNPAPIESASDAVAPKHSNARAVEPAKDTSTPFGRGTLASDPPSDASAPKLEANGTKPGGDAAAFRTNGDANGPANSDRHATTPLSNAGDPKPGGAVVITPARDDHITKPANAADQVRNAALIRSKLVEDWHEWRYCLAPAQAEHRMYMSNPISAGDIMISADDAFDRLLKKAGIRHDEVQCPRAPNKPTLLFRQRYAVKWNQELGNTIIPINWEPDRELHDQR